MRKMILTFFYLGLLLFLNNACETIEKKGFTPAYFLQKAQKELDNGYYPEALTTTLYLQRKFPYSKEMADSYLLKADIYLEQRLFEEANGHYLKFMDLYPSHKKIESAFYKRVKSWTQRVPQISSRDLTLSKKTNTIIDEFLRRFPKSVYKKELNKTKSRILNQLEEKEFNVAQFYFKRGETKAAVMRLQYLLKNYKNGHKYQDALRLILEIASQTGDKKLEAQYGKWLKAPKTSSI